MRFLINGISIALIIQLISSCNNTSHYSNQYETKEVAPIFQESFASCVQKAKEKMSDSALNIMLSDSDISKLGDDDSNKVRAFIESINLAPSLVLNNNQFSLIYNLAHQLNEFDVEGELDTREYKVIYEAELNVTSKDYEAISGFEKTSILNLTTIYHFMQNDISLHDLSITYRINYPLEEFENKINTSSACDLTAESLVITDFEYKPLDEEKVVVSERSYNIMARTKDYEIKITAIKEDIKHRFLWREILGMKDAGLVSLNAYFDTDIPHVSFTVDNYSTNSVINPMSGQYEMMDWMKGRFEIDGQLLTKVESSRNNSFESTKFPEFDQITEVVRKSYWIDQVFSLDLKEFNVLDSDFDPSSLESSEFNFRFQSPVELTFDNYERYFRVDNMSSQQIAGTHSPFTYKISQNESSDSQNFGNQNFPDNYDKTVEKYLKSTPFLNQNLPEISELIASIPTLYRFSTSNPGERNTFDQFEVIASIGYVVTQTISYDYSALSQGNIRVVSVETVLKERKGVCQHFSALYTTLARKLGIPTRIITGWHLTNDKNGKPQSGLHAWVEVYVKNNAGEMIWFPIEPQDSYIIGLEKHQQYFPIMVDYAYESKDEMRGHMNEYLWLIQILNKAKISNF